MDILGLVSFAGIRGVLTVTRADLTDAALTDYGFEEDLRVDLETWLEDWEAVHAAGDRGSQILHLYAKYRCAAWVAVAGQNFTLTQYTDGANAARRSDRVDYQQLREHLESRAAYYQELLLSLLDQLYEPERLSVFGRAAPRRDPVTEGR